MKTRTKGRGNQKSPVSRSTIQLVIEEMARNPRKFYTQTVKNLQQENPKIFVSIGLAGLCSHEPRLYETGMLMSIALARAQSGIDEAIRDLPPDLHKFLRCIK